MADAPSPAIQMTWQNLLFLHYCCAPEEVQNLLPEPFQVETFPDEQGEPKAWVGLVPFFMHNVRPPKLQPVGRFFNFPETNVRTYVRYGDRTGVYFFSLDASQYLAVATARARFSLPYHHATMEVTRSASQVHYKSLRKDGSAPCKVSASFSGEPELAKPGTLDHFLLERYEFLTTARSGEVRVGRVAHEPYRFRRKVDFELKNDGIIRQAGLVPGPICHAAFVDEVNVVGFPLFRV